MIRVNQPALDPHANRKRNRKTVHGVCGGGGGKQPGGGYEHMKRTGGALVLQQQILDLNVRTAATVECAGRADRAAVAIPRSQEHSFGTHSVGHSSTSSRTSIMVVPSAHVHCALSERHQPLHTLLLPLRPSSHPMARDGSTSVLLLAVSALSGFVIALLLSPRVERHTERQPYCIRA